jgi:hypothetical protein
VLTTEFDFAADPVDARPERQLVPGLDGNIYGSAFHSFFALNRIQAGDAYAAWAVANFSSPASPLAQPSADADGDGRTNEQERLAGTNPRDPQSRFHIASALRDAGNALSLTLSTVPGRRYRIQTSASLSGFSNTGSEILAPGRTLTVSVPVVGPRQFVRAVVSGP